MDYFVVKMLASSFKIHRRRKIWCLLFANYRLLLVKNIPKAFKLECVYWIDWISDWPNEVLVNLHWKHFFVDWPKDNWLIFGQLSFWMQIDRMTLLSIDRKKVPTEYILFQRELPRLLHEWHIWVDEKLHYWHYDNEHIFSVGRRSVDFAHCRQPANGPSNAALSSLGFFD